MSLATRQAQSTVTSHDTASRPPAVLSAVVSVFTRLRDLGARARHDRVIAALDARQRADAGIEPTAAEPPRPIMEIERGLMTRLMDMR